MDFTSLAKVLYLLRIINNFNSYAIEPHFSEVIAFEVPSDTTKLGKYHLQIEDSCFVVINYLNTNKTENQTFIYL